jgi:hypothetical protein
VFELYKAGAEVHAILVARFASHGPGGWHEINSSSGKDTEFQYEMTRKKP